MNRLISSLYLYTIYVSHYKNVVLTLSSIFTNISK